MLKHENRRPHTTTHTQLHLLLLRVIWQINICIICIRKEHNRNNINKDQHPLLLLQA